MTAPATPAAITPIMRKALESIDLHGGFRRSELTPAEKRTATALIKRYMVALHDGWLVSTVVGRAELRRRELPQDSKP
jgi:hypothetical protein